MASRFAFEALDAAGKRVRGSIEATGPDAAFDSLKAQGLSPLRLRSDRGAARSTAFGTGGLNDRQVSAFVADLAALLRAGADMRTALSILAPKSGDPALESVARQLSSDISGGGALDEAFAKQLPAKYGFVAALVAAGEASGDLAGALERAAEMLDARLQARDQLVSILSYPIFVLISAIVALLVILLVVVPSLRPLAESPGAEPGAAMRAMLFASRLIGDNLVAIGVALGVTLAVVIAGSLLGAWGPLIDRLLLNGPFRRLSGALVYGSFAVTLGGILAAGASMSEALRLSLKAVNSRTARTALEPVLRAVRQGQSLSNALSEVRGIPQTIVRLAMIGEQSGALGPMLERAGRFEEKAALRKIETAGRIFGPALIVLLGGVIGLLMAGLLSGVSGLGEAALQ